MNLNESNIVETKDIKPNSKKRSPNNDEMINMFIEEFEKYPSIDLRPIMIEEIKTYVLCDASKDMYYEAGRLLYNRWPLFLINWVMRRKHRKVFSRASLPPEWSDILSDFQVKQAKKLLFKCNQRNSFY